MTHEGNMNPVMSYVDMVPDDDLNTRLKFYVSSDFSQKLQRSSVNNCRTLVQGMLKKKNLKQIAIRTDA